MATPLDVRKHYHWQKIDQLYGANISVLSTLIIELDYIISTIPTALIPCDLDHIKDAEKLFMNGHELQKWVKANLDEVMIEVLEMFLVHLHTQDEIINSKNVKEELLNY